MPKKTNKNLLFNLSSIVFLFFFLLYLTTAPRTNISYADSDELIAIGYNLGVAHPPGYSIYILLLHFFTNLPIPGTVAFRAHLLNIILSSLCLSFVFASIYKLIEYIQKTSYKYPRILNYQLDKIIFSAIGSFSLGFSFLFWLWGQTGEKYAFNNLLTSIFIYLIIYIFSSSKIKTETWIYLSLLLGIMLTHHQTSVLLFPTLFLTIYFNKNKIKKNQIIFSAISFTLVIVFSIVSLWMLNNLKRNYSWNFDPSIKGLVGHLARQNFGDTGNVVSAYFPELSKTLANFKWLDFFNYSKKTIQYFGFLSIFTLIIGALHLKKHSNKIFLTLLPSLLLAGLIFPIYVTLEYQGIGTQFVNTKQYLMGYTIFPIFISLGFFLLSSRLLKAIRVFSNQKKYFYLIFLLPIITFSFRLVKIYPQTNMRDFDLISRFHKNILKDLPANSILGCYTDMSCFAFFYEQEVNGFRKDIDIIPISYFLAQKKLDNIPDFHGFDYQENPFKTLDYITWNIDKRPVFVYDFKDDYVELLGRDYAFTYFIPNNYVSYLARQVPEQLPEPDINFSYELKNYKVPELDLMRKWFKATIARNHTFNALNYVEMGYRNITRDQLNIAADLLYQIDEIDRESVEAQRESIEGKNPLINKAPGSKVQEEEESLRIVKIYIDQYKYDKAYVGALGMITANPLSFEGRLLLAEILEKSNNLEYALQEYKNILKYHPDDETSQQKVQELTFLLDDEI